MQTKTKQLFDRIIDITLFDRVEGLDLCLRKNLPRKPKIPWLPPLISCRTIVQHKVVAFFLNTPLYGVHKQRKEGLFIESSCPLLSRSPFSES